MNAKQLDDSIGDTFVSDAMLGIGTTFFAGTLWVTATFKWIAIVRRESLSAERPGLP